MDGIQEPRSRPGSPFRGAAIGGKEGWGALSPGPRAEPRRLTCPSCSHAVWYSARWHRSFTRWYLGRKFSWASALSLSLLWSSLLWGRKRDQGWSRLWRGAWPAYEGGTTASLQVQLRHVS